MQEEFLQPTKNEKKKAWLVLLIGLGIGVVALFCFTQALFVAEVSFGSSPAQACLHLKELLIQLLVFFLCFSAAFSLYFHCFARRVCEQQQFPPHGTLLLYRTPVYRGVAATRRARVVRSLSYVLFVSGIGIALVGFQYAATFTCSAEQSHGVARNCAA